MNKSTDNHQKTMNVFALRLREARVRQGISQERLGVLAGIDEFSASARINQYERGKHLPDLQLAEKLADVLNMPLPYLYPKDDELALVILDFKKSHNCKT